MKTKEQKVSDKDNAFFDFYLTLSEEQKASIRNMVEMWLKFQKD